MQRWNRYCGAASENRGSFQGFLGIQILFQLFSLSSNHPPATSSMLTLSRCHLDSNITIRLLLGEKGGNGGGKPVTNIPHSGPKAAINHQLQNQQLLEANAALLTNGQALHCSTVNCVQELICYLSRAACALQVQTSPPNENTVNSPAPLDVSSSPRSHQDHSCSCPPTTCICTAHQGAATWL